MMVADGHFERAGYITVREMLAAAIAAAVLSIAFSYPIVMHLGAPGVWHDWDFSLQLQWAAYYSVAHFHQFPLWNPWKCGGMPLLGNPQSHFLSPWFLLTLLFGPVIGLHLEIPGHFIAAWLGTYVLGRSLAMRPLAAAGAACAFATSSWLNLRAVEGHMVFLPVAYTPWAIALTIIGARKNTAWASIAAGAVIALAAFEGSPYPPVFIVAILAIVVAVMSIQSRDIRLLRAMLIACAFAAGFAAIKAIPAVVLLSAHPRPLFAADTNSWSEIWRAFFWHGQDPMDPGSNSRGFCESGAYLGLFVVPAMIAFVRPRRALAWIIAAFAAIWLARGDTGALSLWNWFHRLPIASGMQLPQRFLMMAALAIAMMAGFGFDWLLSLRWNAARYAALALLTAAVAENFFVATSHLDLALTDQVQAPAPRINFQQFSLASHLINPGVAVRYSAYGVASVNAGIVRCYEYVDNWQTAAVGSDSPGYRGEQYLLGAGSVGLSRWSPNKLEYDVDAPAPTTLVINQSYEPGWRVASRPGAIISQNGLIAVQIPAGKYRIAIGYLPTGVLIGAGITILTIFLAAAIIWLRRSDLAQADPRSQ
ncbi:MAG TPA: hypothetical protein VMT58_09820 [Candidatus Binataceae bacterium]|nr:hypothetical protein [Candidatus Binataceae bacterium]